MIIHVLPYIRYRMRVLCLLQRSRHKLVWWFYVDVVLYAGYRGISLVNVQNNDDQTIKAAKKCRCLSYKWIRRTHFDSAPSARRYILIIVHYLWISRSYLILTRYLLLYRFVKQIHRARL